MTTEIDARDKQVINISATQPVSITLAGPPTGADAIRYGCLLGVGLATGIALVVFVGLLFDKLFVWVF